MSDCVFCGIVAGTTAADVVHADDALVAFLDQRPVFKGHVLLVPRTHVVTLDELPAELRDPFLATAQRLCRAVVAGLGAQGSFVAVNNTVSQSVPHLHLHVVDRDAIFAANGLPYVFSRFRVTGRIASTDAFNHAEATGAPVRLGPVRTGPRRNRLPLDQVIVTWPD